jgi:hypothetical protein
MVRLRIKGHRVIFIDVSYKGLDITVEEIRAVFFAVRSFEKLSLESF